MISMFGTITYKQFKLINFPIFEVPKKELSFEDGLIFQGDKIIDDLNQGWDTLGARRLHTPHPTRSLRSMLRDEIDLVSSKHRDFIDNKGYCFTYERTIFGKVRYRKILDVVDRDTATVLVIEQSRLPIVVRRPPPLGKSWVGIIFINNIPWIPYEYGEEFRTDFRKKI